MTYKEKLAQEHPENVIKQKNGKCWCCGCPKGYGYADTSYCKLLDYTSEDGVSADAICIECWNREMPERKIREEEFPSNNQRNYRTTKNNYFPSLA